MMILSSILLWAVIHVLICGTQTTSHYGPHTTPSEDACIDKSSNCADNKFQCLTSSYVKRKCKKTCNLCKPVLGATPHDTTYPTTPNTTSPTPPKISCSTVESTCKRYEVCNPDRRIQTLCQKEECTRDGQHLGQRDTCFVQGILYDLETKRCVKPPTGSALCPVCKIIESSCETFDVCIPLKRKQKLCKRESCSIDGVIQGEWNKCPGAMLYDTQTSTCVAKPTGSALCPVCKIVESTCETFDVCIPLKREQKLCKRESCTIDGVIQGEWNKCKGAMLYDTQSNTCVAKPTGSALCPVCKIVESSCETFDLCIPLKREQKLCKSERCTIDGVIQGEWNKCPGAMLYDTQTSTCVAKPTGSALCTEPKWCPGAMIYDTQTGKCVAKPTVRCPIDTRPPGDCTGHLRKRAADPYINPTVVSVNCRGPVGGPSYDCPTGLLCCQDACLGLVCKHPQ